MSDSDDDVDIPPREVCEQRCQEFAQITGTDTALAMFYLQDLQWDLQKSLNAFFEGNPEASPNKTTMSKMSTNEKLSKETSVTPVDPEPHRIRLLSWNIDGLDQNNRATRTQAVCDIIAKEKPDVVYLQEVVPMTYNLLEDGCPLYQLVPAADSGYYTCILLRCDSVTYSDHAITPFFTSKMARNLLQVKAKVKGIDMLLMTSHLESTKSHAAERKRQLKSCFKTVTDAEANRTVVFGGDLNLRDDELAAVGGIPDDMYDIWEVTGKRPEAKYTWDCMRNDNLEISGNFKPRARFDRLYLRNSKPTSKLKPVYFELVGIERLTKCQRFASDHWGMLSHYDKV